jgi:lysyl-tRNA synthetase class 2
MDVLRLRSDIIKYLRKFFDGKDFVEFQTPILAGGAGGAVARPFATTAVEFPDKELSLRIAPELWLKRLVIGGVDRVYEIGPAFRNEGIDSTHNPEFTICEFYSAYATLSDLVSLTGELIAGLARHCAQRQAHPLRSLPEIDLEKYRPPYRQIEFIPGLETALGFKLPDFRVGNAREALAEALERRNVPLTFDARSIGTLPKLLDRLAATYLEPQSAGAPVFITHHPACMSPLSKSLVCPTTGQLVSARAELFVHGRELANMYEEENDPFAQRSKFLEQARYRDRSGEDVVPDEGYVQALESGLPPTGGWGCGIERLVMLFSGVTRISDCLSFGNLRNVVGLASVRAERRAP